MIRVRNNEIRPYFSKVTLTTTSGDEIHYTDTPSLYEAMVDKFKHITGCSIESVTLTDDEQTRLDALKDLTGELEEKAELEAFNFVKYGYVSPINYCKDGSCAPQPMLKLLAKWDGVSKEALITSYKSQLGTIRKVREFGGVRFNGMIADTEKQDQNSISNTVLVLEKTSMKSVKFKFRDGWQELTLDSLILLASKVATHVQICFEVEEAIASKLRSMTLLELANLKENPFGNNQGENVVSLEVMYNAAVDQAEESMEK